MIAFRALDIKFPRIGRAATANGMHRVQVTGQDGTCVFGDVCIVILVDNSSQFHDHTFLRSTWRVLISAFMVVWLSFSVISERWV